MEPLNTQTAGKTKLGERWQDFVITDGEKLYYGAESGQAKELSEVGGGGGITHIDIWYLNSNFLPHTYLDDFTIKGSNWTRVNSSDGFGLKGAAMSHSDGRFTFPQIGKWEILFKCMVYGQVTTRFAAIIGYDKDNLITSIGGKNIAQERESLTASGSTNIYVTLSPQVDVDVISTNSSCIFGITHGDNPFNFEGVANPAQVYGASGLRTFVRFRRLGD